MSYPTNYDHNKPIRIVLIFVVIILSSSLIINSSSACFITNCPPGGKRSGGSGNYLFGDSARKCTTCGPPGTMGQCYGSHICCSKEFGCLIGTPETEVCLLENQLPTPCENFGKSCGGYDENAPFNGHCAAAGICCSTDICRMDPTCHDHSGPHPVLEIEFPHTAKMSPILNEDDEDCLTTPADTKQPQLLIPLITPARKEMIANEEEELTDQLHHHPQFPDLMIPTQDGGQPIEVWNPNHLLLLETAKRYFEDEGSHSSSSAASNNINNSNDNNMHNKRNAAPGPSNGAAAKNKAAATGGGNDFPGILKSSRPGLNSIMRKLFQFKNKRDYLGRFVRSSAYSAKATDRH